MRILWIWLIYQAHHHQTKKSEVTHTHTHKGVVEATGFRLNFQPVFQILENRILHNKITVNLACPVTKFLVRGGISIHQNI